MHPDSDKPLRAKRTRPIGDSILTYGLGAIAVIAALWFTYQFVEPAPPRSISLATGDPDGAYHRHGEQLQRAFRDKGIDLTLVPTAGSLENLQKLQDDQNPVDLAFVQSGIGDAARYPALESLGSLYYEPLWIFVPVQDRRELLSELRGARIATGQPGSGTAQVVSQLLADNGLNDADIAQVPLGAADAATALLAGDVDVAMMIAGVDAAAVQRLLQAADVRLMSLSRASAYARKYPWFTHLTLPRGVIDLQRDVPDSDVRLVSPVATLVARADVHPALIDLMMQASDELFDRNTLFSVRGDFPSVQHTDFPISAEAQRYFRFGVPILQRFLPFWAANLIDRLKVMALPLVALMLPLSRILPPTYRWTVRKKVYRWYEQVQLIDQRAHEHPDPDNLRDCLRRLELIEEDARKVEVPLGYAHELYALRQHIDLLSEQIRRRLI